MDSIIITGKTKFDIELLAQLAKKMGLKAKVLSEEEKEDIYLLSLMSEARNTKLVSKETVIRNLRK